MNRIITIGREFGSGGRELGRRLSERLGFAYYDQEIISEIARRTELSEQYVQSIVEHQPVISFPIHIGTSFYPAPTPVFDQSMSVYQEQARIIEEMAQKSDCIIVGRCGDYILKEYEPFRMFVYADMDSKMERCRKKAPEGEKMTDRELKQHIQGIDKRGQSIMSSIPATNGDKLNFDLCINTSRTVIKELVPAVARLFEKDEKSAFTVQHK